MLLFAHSSELIFDGFNQITAVRINDIWLVVVKINIFLNKLWIDWMELCVHADDAEAIRFKLLCHRIDCVVDRGSQLHMLHNAIKFRFFVLLLTACGCCCSRRQRCQIVFEKCMNEINNDYSWLHFRLVYAQKKRNQLR